MRALLAIGACMTVFAAAGGASAAPEDWLDPTFGEGGWAEVPILASELAQQPDGKLVVAGDGKVARITVDGTLDDTFGEDGIVTLVPPGDGFLEARDIAVQEDGKILVVDRVADAGGNLDLAVYRLNDDGTADASFGGGDGIATADFGGHWTEGHAVTTDGLDRILAAGFWVVDDGRGWHLTVMRFLPTGALDATFGSGGVVSAPISDTLFAEPSSIDVGDDGAIAVAATTTDDENCCERDLAVFRLAADGSLVEQTIFGFGNFQNEEAGGVQVTPDGIVVGLQSGRDALVQRYGASGLDATFGTNGTASLREGHAADVAVDGAGRIVAATAESGLAYVARLLDDGSFDPAFGESGALQYGGFTFGSCSSAPGVILQPDGKIVLLNDCAGGLARLLGEDGSSPPADDTDGDGIPDADDPDDDNDGLSDADEAAAGTDPLDTDSDDDEVADGADNCRLVANGHQADNDADGRGDACDSDDDNDGVADGDDAFPLDPGESGDADGDGTGDNADLDDDNDGLTDVQEQLLGTDPRDSDTDGDGAADGSDNCALAANPDQRDSDGDGIGDACDADDDGDGLADTGDNCPSAANAGQRDTDGDGIGDACDAQTGPPSDKEQCKQGRWADFNYPRTFKNQGECVASVARR